MQQYLTPQKDTPVHFACPVCHYPASISTADTLLSNSDTVCNMCCTHPLDDDFTQCDNENCACNNPYDIITADIILRHDAYNIFTNPKTIINTTWYHVTTVAPEDMLFDGEINMHVGQPATVKALQELRYQDTPVYVYELRLNNNVRIYDEFVHDKSSWYAYEKRLATNEVSAFAYVNRWEAPGSISLFVRNDALEIVGVSRPEIITKRKEDSDYKFIY